MAQDAAWQHPTGTECSRIFGEPVLCQFVLSWVHSIVIGHFSLTFDGVVTYLCDIWFRRLTVAAVLLVLPLDNPCGFARGIC